MSCEASLAWGMAIRRPLGGTLVKRRDLTPVGRYACVVSCVVVDSIN